MWSEIKKKKKEFNDKFFEEGHTLFKQWLKENPTLFVVARNTTPSFNDGDPCTPYFALLCIGPCSIEWDGTITFENEELCFSEEQDMNTDYSRFLWVIDFIQSEWEHLSEKYRFSSTYIEVVFFFKNEEVNVKKEYFYED